MSITAYTKPDCPYCARAKEALEEAGLDYRTRDVKGDARLADESVYFSGVATVPQVFVGDLHVNGSTDVLALHERGLLKPLAEAVRGTLEPDAVDAGALARGAEDLLLRDVIPESDGTHDPDPDAWSILHFYKDFFGFWPNCFYYQHHWPEAYKLFVYCHNVGAIGGGKEIIGAPVMMSAGFASSEVQGCSYCMTHMTAAGGDQSLGMNDMARRGAASGKRDGDAAQRPEVG